MLLPLVCLQSACPSECTQALTGMRFGKDQLAKLPAKCIGILNQMEEAVHVAKPRYSLTQTCGV